MGDRIYYLQEKVWRSTVCVAPTNLSTALQS